MEKFNNFTENLMKVVLVPDDSSDSVSNVEKSDTPQDPVDNFSKNVADYLGNFEKPCCGEEEGVEGEEGEEAQDEAGEEGESSEFSVFHDTNGLKISMNGVDFTFPEEVVAKIREVLTDDSSEDANADITADETTEDAEHAEHEASETPEEEAEERESGVEDEEEGEDEEEEKPLGESLIEDGFMKHMHDIHGVKEYLVQNGQIGPNDMVTDSEESAASLRRKGYEHVYVMDSYEERGRWTLRVYDPVTQKDILYYDSDAENEQKPEIAEAMFGESKKEKSGNPWAKGGKFSKEKGKKGKKGFKPFKSKKDEEEE